MGNQPGQVNQPTNLAGNLGPTRKQRLTTWARSGGGHGSIRGADSPNSSPQFEGLFGRMFRTLPMAIFPENDLIALAQAMTAEPEVVEDTNGNPVRDQQGHLIPKATPESKRDDEENFGIPAGYTYLGQFIDHDITLILPAACRSRTTPRL